jgi:hypothetical protein
LEYTPQELSGVLFYWNLDEESKMKNEWERTRIQTFFLVNIQLDKKHKIDYGKFSRDIWSFAWEKKREKKNKPGEGVMNVEQWNKLLLGNK